MRSKLEARDKVNKFRSRSIHYFENALRLIDAGDAEKASEFLWGITGKGATLPQVTDGSAFLPPAS